MLLRVTAKDKGAGKEQNIIVRSPYGLNNTQIKIMKNRLKIWQSERKTISLKKEIDIILYNIEKLLSTNINALSWEKITKLQENVTLLIKLKKNKKSYTELLEVINNAKHMYNLALKDIKKFQKIINKIKALINAIDIFNKILEKEDKKDESRLLIQGKVILHIYLKQNLSFDELQKIFSSVQSSYANSKAKLLTEKINILLKSDDLKKWLVDIKKVLFNPILMEDYLIGLKQIKNIDVIINLFQNDDFENRMLIQNLMINNLKDKEYSFTTHILILSLCLDFNIITMIDEFPQDNINENLLLFAVFNKLKNKGTKNDRIKVAQIISNIFPLDKYIPKIVELICDEQDKDVKNFLLDYLHKHPKGIFHYFFINADAKTKNKILNNKELLINLVNENQESSCIPALESLTKFPIDEIAPILLSYANNNNFKIRYKSLELIMKSKIKNEIVKEKMITTMCNQKGDKVIHYLLLTLMDKNNKIHNLAKSYFNENMDDLDTIIKKLFILILKVIEKKHHLRIKDKFFLNKLLKKHPEMDDVVNTLKNIANK